MEKSLKYSVKLKSIRDKYGLTQEELAVELDCDRSYLSQIERGKKEPGPKLAERIRIMEKVGIYRKGENVKKSRDFPAIRSVPVISWTQAGEAVAYEEIPQSWQEFVPSDCEDDKAFGVEICGDSMEPQFKDGDIAVLMPGKRPRPGCLVVAKLRTDGVVFKIFNFNGEKTFVLSSYNKLYPPMMLTEEDLHWIYPVHSIIKKLWR